MGVVMRLALTWVGLGLLANTAVATLSQEAIDELVDELQQKSKDSGPFVDPAEDELFKLLADNGDDEVPDDESQELNFWPEPRYAGDSSEVIQSIDEIDSITPIKSIKEIDSITPIKHIKKIPDDIAHKFIKDQGLVPTDEGGYNSGGYKGRPQVGAGRYGSEPTVESYNTAQDDFKQGLKDAIGLLNTLVQDLGEQGLCGKRDETTTFNYRPSDRRPGHYGKKSKLPFDKDDIESIDAIKSMKEITSMLPVKKITEVKSITPIKSIQEVTGLYELTDEQADQLRRLNAKWSRKSDHRRRKRRRF